MTTYDILPYCNTYNYIDIIYVHMHKKELTTFLFAPNDVSDDVNG